MMDDSPSHELGAVSWELELELGAGPWSRELELGAGS